MKVKKGCFIILWLICFFLFISAAKIHAGNELSQKKSPIDKGNFNIAGTLSIQSMGGELYEDDGERLTISFLSPQFYYFVIPNLAVGGNISYSKQSQSDISLSTLGIGPTLSYFFRIESDKIYPFIRSGFLYSRYSIDVERIEDSFFGYDFFFGGGLAFMLGKKVAVISEVNYHLQSLKEEGVENPDSGNVFVFTVGFSVFLY